MDQFLEETVTDKINPTENKLMAAEGQLIVINKEVATMTDQSNSIKSLGKLIRKLHSGTNKIRSPFEQMTENRVFIHTVGKLALIIAGFSILTFTLFYC
jgi:hypothetical protein